MDQQVKRDCPVCGAAYDAELARLKHGRQTTCSRVCSYKLRASQLSDSEQHKCGACGQTILRSRSQVKSRHGLVFCSPACAYARRRRIVSKPYVIVAEYDRKAAGKKAWETRRANPKPYPETARIKAAANAVKGITRGKAVSKFERKVAEMFNRLGIATRGSIAARNRDGTFAHVFDIYLPTRGILVECHGTYWHGGRWTWSAPNATQLRNLRYEQAKFTFAAERGLDIRVLWEQHFRGDPAGACLSVVR
jgi:endogenous inhibitor of DNA gyrase (YacG/DUF329 family)/G:T-mismatch repair DNA endonuclease (very short patch repair protein)